MRKERLFYLVTIAALVLVIWLLQTCNGKQKGLTMADRDILKIEIPKTKFFPKYIPVPYEVQLPGETILDTIDFTDTNYCKEVTKQLLSTVTYNDTIRDSTIDIFIQEKVSQNKIQERLVGYKIKKPFITLADDRFQVFVAGNVGTDLKGFVAGPEIMFKPKNNYLFKLGVDFNTTGTITYRVGFGWLIRFKKRLK